jgi:hypothetical protein
MRGGDENDGTSARNAIGTAWLNLAEEQVENDVDEPIDEVVGKDIYGVDLSSYGGEVSWSGLAGGHGDQKITGKPRYLIRGEKIQIINELRENV